MRYLVYSPLPQMVSSIAEEYRVREKGIKPSLLGPHISFFFGEIKTENEAAIKEQFLSLRVSPIAVDFDKYDLLDHNSWALKIRKTDSLQRLHNSILDIVEPYVNRDAFEPLPKSWCGNKLAEESYSRTGQPYWCNQFTPHVTLFQSNEGVHPVEDEKLSSLGWILTRLSLARREPKPAPWEHIAMLSLIGEKF